MSMLAHFFSPEGDKSIFDGLEIAKDKELCEKYMGKHPVIFLSFKGIEAPDYDSAYRLAAQRIAETANQFHFLLDSEKLSEFDKTRYKQLLNKDMSEVTFDRSLLTLTKLLDKHYGNDAILLIDDCEVPMVSAYKNGYYKRMDSLLESPLGAALKTNFSLECGMLTGCFRVLSGGRDSSLNNWTFDTISDYLSAEYFGFTDEDVRHLLAYYGQEDHYEDAKNWYGGYQFGDKEMYCPRDVLNYEQALLDCPSAQPQNYWTGTSDDVLKKVITGARATERSEIEKLLAGDTIREEVSEYLIYSDMYDEIDNAWTLLCATGYLTMQGRPDDYLVKLKIPNLEVRDAFVKQIRACFQETVQSNTDTLNRFCTALLHGDTGEAERCFDWYLQKTIDNGITTDGEKALFYQNVLQEILAWKESWSTKTSQENSDGLAVVLIKPEQGNLGVGICIALRYNRDRDQGCQDALDQIDTMKGGEMLQKDGRKTILKYGIGCFGEKCQVMLRQ